MKSLPLLRTSAALMLSAALPLSAQSPAAPAPAITEVAAEKIAAEKPKDGKVLVVATFKLLGEARRVRFRMEQEDGAWKIADILGHDFTSLREALESTGGKSTPQAR